MMLFAFLVAFSPSICLTPDGPAHAQVLGSNRPAYTLSTASTGGAFHQGGVSLSALVKIKLLPDEQIDLTTRNSSGSMENIARLSNGTTDFAIVQGLLGYHARRGTGPARELGPKRDLRAVTMLWPNVEHFIIRKSAASSGSIGDLSNLRDKAFSFGREASAIGSSRFLLANLGLDMNEDFDQAFLSFRASAAAFRRGDIDGLSLPASTPISNIIDLIASLGPEAVMLNWTEKDLDQADADLGLWSPLTIPSGTYPGQNEAIQTIAQPNFLAVRADVDDDVVYALTKVIFENLPFLQRLHRPFQFLNPESAIKGLPVPLHPGALRYFQEIRLDMADTLVAEGDYTLFGGNGSTAEQIRDEVRRGVVSLMTPEDGTSDQLAHELMDVLGRDGELRLLPLKGKGAAHNLADLLYLSGVDIGVLQIDAMEAARRRGILPDLADNIRYITKWLDHEVHLLVGDDVLRIEHLAGKPVNFGPPGGGSEVTASRIFNEVRVTVDQRSLPHEVALEKLKDGEIAGMVYVAGKPVPLFDKIEVRDGLRLLSLPKTENESEHDNAASLTEADYPTLIFGERTIETVSVPSVLAAYNWSADSPRYQPIERFIETLFARLDELQTSPRHPKWQDVDPSFHLSSWQRHQAAEAYLRQSRTVTKTAGQGGPLLPSANQAKAGSASLSSGLDGGEGNGPPRKPVITSSHRPVF